jgi:hypothetical protein
MHDKAMPFTLLFNRMVLPYTKVFKKFYYYTHNQVIFKETLNDKKY